MDLVDAFEARFPEFPQEVVAEAIPRLEPSFIYWYNFPWDTSENPNKDTNNAVLLMAAHILSVDQTPSPGHINQFMSTSVQGVSGSYRLEATVTDRVSFFSATKYGQQFLQVINKRRGAFFV